MTAGVTLRGARRPVVGYVSGVFDMFHIGHLNIVMRARAQCDWLVVGVVTDEVVEAAKGKVPVIPLAERLQIVRGLRDVDEVVVDPWVDKFETWRHVLRFDVLYKGDDWKDTPAGVTLQRQLAEVGARIEFFPYTSHTSSTLLREVLTQLANTPVEPFPEGDFAEGVVPEDDFSQGGFAGDEQPESKRTAAAVARQGDAAVAASQATVAGAARCPACGQRVPSSLADDPHRRT